MEALKESSGLGIMSQSSVAGHLGRQIEQLCYGLCIAGGLVLVAGLGVALASVVGRMLSIWGLGPIAGDNEVMQAACVIAAFAFMPWCQLKNGHVAVDILVSRLGRRTGLAISAISDLGMTLAALFITWRLWANLVEKYVYGETTMLLNMPIWTCYLGAFVGSVCFVLACIVTLSQNLSELFANRK